jgi:hypothetical protein
MDTLPQLPMNVVCHLTENCTGIHCCIDVELLGRSLHVYFNIDPCYHQLNLTIERMIFDISLLDYKWGKVLFLWTFISTF